MSFQELYNYSQTLLSNGSNTSPAATVILGLITTFMGSRDARPPRDLDGDSFDFVIVGGGSAGSVLANRLSQIKKWDILLLEAGGDTTELDDVPAYKTYLQSDQSTILWPHWTVPEPATCGGAPCFWPAGKVLGGTSTINTMLYARGFQHDYDHWERLGNNGWNWKSALEYFKKSENNLDAIYAKDTKYHATGGNLNIQTFNDHDQNTYNVIKAYNELGYQNTDYNGPHPTGIFLMQGTVKNGVRSSTNNDFLKPVRGRKNLKIATGIRVTRLLMGGKKVQGVEYVFDKDHTKTGKVYAKKEVILSAGTLSSPQILMLSGIGPKNTLDKFGIKVVKDLKVGHNLQNHATSVGVTLNLTRSSTVPKSNEEWLQHMKQYLENFTGPLSSTGISQMSGYTPSSFGTKDFPDLKFGFSFDDVDTAGAKMPGTYYGRITIGPYHVRPKSKGIFTINSTDPFAQPLIYPKLATHPHDREAIVQGHLFAMKIAKTKAFADAGYVLETSKIQGCEQEKFGTREYFECAITRYVGSAHHYAGTCKMGPEHDKEAVVDHRLKVYGIHNLRVADASIMPVIPSANTNAPAIMIGEKASDIIKEDMGLIPRF